MSKTCPTCGAQLAKNPRDELLAHLQNKVNHASRLVDELVDEEMEATKPHKLLPARIHRRDKYQSWVNFVKAIK